LQRVVDHADGWMPNRVTPKMLTDSRRQLDELATAAGRDAKAITITVFGQAPDKALCQSLLDAGANRVVVKPEYVETEAEMGAQLERFAAALF
jgi:alkanesulfonate monooxygenase SsuD/methylene tetrahydromethanopterin reductase-like flavin-dependent oxidoreductase (luciferase family)